jgi:hypothetical protein
MDDILVPCDAHSTIDFPSLLRFYEKGGVNEKLGMYHLQSSLTRMASASSSLAARHPESPLIMQLSRPLRDGYDVHMTSLQHPGTGCWLYAVPRGPRFVFSNVDYVCAIRTRLYVQGHTAVLTRCNCEDGNHNGDGEGAYVVDPLHGLSCIRTRGRQITKRHNMVVDVVANAIRQCGAVVELEPTGYEHNKNRRPDIFAVVNNVPTFIDVGIVQPSAKSYRRMQDFAVTRQREKQKIEKYSTIAMQNDAVVMPFIVETNGGLGEQARYVIQDIAGMANCHALAFAPSEIVRDMLDGVSVAIQKGNAMAVRGSLSNTVISRWRRNHMSTAQNRRMNEDRNRNAVVHQLSVTSSAATVALTA